MNNSTGNFTTPETSTNSTTLSIGVQQCLYICIHCINVLFGLPTHSYIIWLIVTGTKSGVALAFFNLNLSVCEIGNCLISLFYIVIYCAMMTHLARLVDFFVGLGITGRSLFQCLMCVERYLAVVHPVTFLKYKPLRYRVICCSVAWIILLGSCLVCMFTIDLFYIYVWLFSLQQLLFLSIQLFCLVSVLRALKQSGPGEKKREREEENHMKRRAFFVILITTINMFVIYVPFTVSAFSFILAQHFIYDLFCVGFIYNLLAGFVQPVLHLHRVGKLYCLCCL